MSLLFVPDINRSGSYEPGREQPFIQDAYRSGLAGRNSVPASWRARPDKQTIDAITRAANRGDLELRVQPFNKEEIETIKSGGDPRYLEELRKHYKSIPEEYRRKANVSVSPDEEFEAWKKLVPPLTINNSGNSTGSYYSGSGDIVISNKGINNEYKDIWGNANIFSAFFIPVRSSLPGGDAVVS